MDTNVPASQGVQGFDRFAYGLNNPLYYTDPSGHWVCEDLDCERPLDYNQPNWQDTNSHRDRCSGLDCMSHTEKPETSDTGEMSDIEKIGMGFAVALTDLFVVLPIEARLFVATIEASATCALGGALACVVDVPLVAADIAVADFAVSLNTYAAKSIASGHKGQFEWIIIPAIIDQFKPKE